MKPISFLLFLIFLQSCNSNIKKSKSLSLTTIKQQKVYIDKRVLAHQKSIMLFAKIKSGVVPVVNQNCSDDVEYSYAILKNSADKIIMILSGPTDESGDSDISCIHYFDGEGNTIAFEIRTNFFNSECTSGVAKEVETKYYNSNFTMLSQSYSLKDEKGNKLVKSNCTFPYNFSDYKIYKSVNECLAGYDIKLAQ